MKPNRVNGYIFFYCLEQNIRGIKLEIIAGIDHRLYARIKFRHNRLVYASLVSLKQTLIPPNTIDHFNAFVQYSRSSYLQNSLVYWVACERLQQIILIYLHMYVLLRYPFIPSFIDQFNSLL